MDPAAKATLEKVALERLNATADDDEQWSFLFRTEGSADFLYCPWYVTEDWEFDGEWDNLDLPWSSERRDLISRGKVELTEDELIQWRHAMCRKLADGSDWCQIAWIVPLVLDGLTAGHALFLCDSDAAEPPRLEGIFDSPEEAKAKLVAEGAMSDARVLT